MKISNKLYNKYAGSPIRPPKPEVELEQVEIPVTPNEIPDKWLQLMQDAEMMDPLTEVPAQSPEELLEVVREEPVQRSPEENIGGEMSTKPPPGRKKADFTPNTLLKMCSQYYDLCYKL